MNLYIHAQHCHHIAMYIIYSITTHRTCPINTIFFMFLSFYSIILQMKTMNKRAANSFDIKFDILSLYTERERGKKKRAQQVTHRRVRNPHNQHLSQTNNRASLYNKLARFVI
jgi:hypothetical protein